jgi:predicted branched-subunit amino acid permease
MPGKSLWPANNFSYFYHPREEIRLFHETMKNYFFPEAFMHSLAGFRSGCRAAAPVVLGFLPIAVAYGVLARQAGISPLMTVLMSVMVFAGSSQFIGVSMIGSGASFGFIIMTTFLVNLRHMLMSASLSPYYQKFARRWLPILAFGLTDETFALISTAFRENPRMRVMSLACSFPHI